jgi:hypothetical protein
MGQVLQAAKQHQCVCAKKDHGHPLDAGRLLDFCSVKYEYKDIVFKCQLLHENTLL